MRKFSRESFRGDAPLDETAIFYECKFTDIVTEDADLVYDVFIRCEFTNVNLYWSMSFDSIFLGCKLTGCDLRGDFNNARFIDCVFTGCDTGPDELGIPTEWEGAAEMNCTVTGPPLPIVESEE